MKNKIFLFCLLICSTVVIAQNKKVKLQGQVLDEQHNALPNIFVHIQNNPQGAITNNSGHFTLLVPVGIPVRIVASGVNYNTANKIVFLNNLQTEKLVFVLKEKLAALKDVKVSTDKARQETGIINIDAKKALINPSVVGGIEGLIKTYVGSNNELTSQYSVRGGNYDENLVYVNGFEIYRPYLVSSGQQEGLSFINPTLTQNVQFYTGGYQAKYGDKMSSVLDVTYKKPKENGGTAYLSLLEQGLSFEGLSKNKKFTYVVGARNRNNRNVLSSQPTKGNYIPSAADVQGLLTYTFSPKWGVELLGNYSTTKFSYYPEETKLTASVFSPLYVANYGVDIDFSGSEKDKYSTQFLGLTLVQKPNKKITLKYLFSYFGDKENQNQDITGAYIFGARDANGNIDPSPGNVLGVGVNQTFARNKLNIDLLTAQHLGSWRTGKSYVQWGLRVDNQKINSVFNQWQMSDSVGYSLPSSSSELKMWDVLNSHTSLNLVRLSGFVQNNILFSGKSEYTLQIGGRFNYNNLNNELLLSPRAGFSFHPKYWQQDMVFKASLGRYVQPAFYREMLAYNGVLNTQIKAQKSWQGVLGWDYNLKIFNRPAKITTEAYYKYMTDVVPYDIDNVNIRYYGHNNAKAYTTGIETRLFAQLVKDADSWLSLGFMRAREKIEGLNYYRYYNAVGQEITAASQDKQVADSVSNPVGWLRRPTDRLVTFGMFFQDYLSSNKNIKVHLNTIYGTNLPYNIPGSTRYRNALKIPSYFRVDIGFSALLLSEESIKRSHSPFKGIKNIWASLEVFNLIDKDNTISYQLLKDFDNNTYALPNRLTSRLLNFKIVVNW